MGLITRIRQLVEREEYAGFDEDEIFFWDRLAGMGYSLGHGSLSACGLLISNGSLFDLRLLSLVTARSLS